jgi:hypothetical protein
MKWRTTVDEAPRGLEEKGLFARYMAFLGPFTATTETLSHNLPKTDS